MRDTEIQRYRETERGEVACTHADQCISRVAPPAIAQVAGRGVRSLIAEMARLDAWCARPMMGAHAVAAGRPRSVGRPSSRVSHIWVPGDVAGGGGSRGARRARPRAVSEVQRCEMNPKRCAMTNER